MRKYKIIHQRCKGMRHMHHYIGVGLFDVKKIKGKNQWFFPDTDNFFSSGRWGELGDYLPPATNTYHVKAKSIKSVIRHILKHLPCESGDEYNIGGKYIGTDIKVVIK